MRCFNMQSHKNKRVKNNDNFDVDNLLIKLNRKMEFRDPGTPNHEIKAKTDIRKRPGMKGQSNDRMTGQGL